MVLPDYTKAHQTLGHCPKVLPLHRISVPSHPNSWNWTNRGLSGSGPPLLAAPTPSLPPRTAARQAFLSITWHQDPPRRFPPPLLGMCPLFQVESILLSRPLLNELRLNVEHFPTSFPRVHYTFHQTLAHRYHCMWAVLLPCSVYMSFLRLSFLRAEMHNLAQSRVYKFFRQKMKPTL